MAALLVLWPEARLHAQPATAVAVPRKPDLVLGDFSLAAQGYKEQEFFISGQAVSYRAGVDAAGKPAARNWGSHAYKTRIVVLSPVDPKRFNGTVVVEWLNVSAGVDVPVEWLMLHRELLRDGYAYVAVSVQKMGVESRLFADPPGPLGAPLKAADPPRYGSLSLPGDGYGFDIFTQIGHMLKAEPESLLGALRPRRLLAAGDSQSAIYLATYINFVDPLARIYDGYLIHSRGGAAAGLTWTTISSASRREMRQPVRLREDLRVPVLQLSTETDLIGLAGFTGADAARQPDSTNLRSWEIAGAAHVDNYLMGGALIDTQQVPVKYLAETWEPHAQIGGTIYKTPINNAPQHHYVEEAALARLDKWVRSGKPPPHGAPITLDNAVPAGLSRDDVGNVSGGIRTPWIDDPTSTTSGENGLAGSTSPFSQTRLAQLYPGGRQEYLDRFAADLDRTIAAGFILPADRTEILAIAKANYPAP